MSWEANDVAINRRSRVISGTVPENCMPSFKVNSLIAYAMRPMTMEMAIFFIMGMMILGVSFGAHIILIHSGKGNIKTCGWKHLSDGIQDFSIPGDGFR